MNIPAATHREHQWNYAAYALAYGQKTTDNLWLGVAANHSGRNR